MNPHLELLLSPLYAATPLISEHLADLRASGLSDETVAGQKLRTVPPAMLPSLLGFDVTEVRSAYLIPFPDPRGGWMDHVRMKVFPPYKGRRGDTVKYFKPRGSGVRLFFPLATLDAALHSDVPLWCIEGEKKALAVAQIGLPAVGFAGIDAWHRAGSPDLIPDFNFIHLAGRLVELVPDADWRIKPSVARGACALAKALEDHCARVRLVVLPDRKTI